MANEKSKVGKLKPETKEKLEFCLEMTSTDAVDLITQAFDQDLFDKQSRGDKVWLYRGANAALTCLEKIKRVLLDDEQTVGDKSERSITPEAQAAKILEEVNKKLGERRLS